LKLLLALGLFTLSCATPTADKPIRQDLIWQETILEKQIGILNLQACSEAGILYSECSVNWQTGKVSKRKI
jgi:hypothetical protein